VSRTHRAVIFDLDGTLTPVRSVWRHLHEALGLWDGEAERHQAAFLAGDLTYEEYCARDAAHWKGRPEAELLAIADAIPYRPGARETISRLQQEGLLIGVISTGLTVLAERVHRELDLAFTIANRLVAERGVLTGEVQVNVEHDDKGAAVDLFCSRFGVDPGEVISIGDSDGDIPMFARTGFSIAFNPASEKTARAASLVRHSESVLDLVGSLT
jgi:phosphoserine phosphatase